MQNIFGLIVKRDFFIQKRVWLTSRPDSGSGGKYLHMNTYKMAAAWLFQIIRKRPFIISNKRTEVVSALVFLILDGVGILADQIAWLI
jgi:hypothetical protein